MGRHFISESTHPHHAAAGAPPRSGALAARCLPPQRAGIQSHTLVRLLAE